MTDVIERYDQHPYFMVVDAAQPKYLFPKHLGGIPSPRLIDACSDGKPHEAWRTDEGQWRLRDVAWDAAHKPADVPYTRVYVGRPPDAED
jgi:hypothetical protein